MDIRGWTQPGTQCAPRTIPVGLLDFGQGDRPRRLIGIQSQKSRQSWLPAEHKHQIGLADQTLRSAGGLHALDQEVEVGSG
jgi:hypothetical protein